MDSAAHCALLSQWHIRMALWRKRDISFVLDDEAADHPVATLRIATPAGRLFAMANILAIGRSILVAGLHVHGERDFANRVGAANLLVLVQAFMEVMDVDELVVAGGIRSTGAKPGKTPRHIRFTRRPDDHLGR